MKNCPACQKTYPDDFGLCPRDGAALVEAGAWIEGAVVRGKYRILSKLGQGGMGAVYKAVHLRFGEVRALKVMSPHVAGDPVFVKRFEQEAVNTRKLQHPNAVRVDDIDESEDGRPFIVMEFIEGKSLKHVIESEGPLPVARVCAIIKQVAAALGAAHELGMVHRDIKPDNIVLVAQGSPSSPAALPALKPGKDLETPQGQRTDPALLEIAKVLDFGIAKLKEVRATETSGLSLTGTGVVIGTPQYMSPEQAAGKRGDDLDGRSDLYSLGVVMYEMLSGSLPFKSDTPMAMLHAHMQEQPRPILSVRPDLQIPESIAAVVMKCLEKKPEHRPATAAALIAELERAEKQRDVPLAPTVVPTPTPPTPAAKAAPPQAIERDAVAPPRETEARPRAKEAPGQPAPRMPATRLPQHPAAAGSATNRIVWAAVATVLVVVALGAWYFSSGIRGVSPNPVQENKAGTVSVPAKGRDASGSGQQSTGSTGILPVDKHGQDGRATVPGGEPTSGNTGNKSDLHVASPQPLQQPTNQGSTTSVSSKSNSPHKKSPLDRLLGRATKSPPPKPVASQIDNGERQKNINAAKTEGDLYFQNGEYDNAISAYQNGLKSDPTDAELLQKMQKARNAKATEGAIK